MWIKWKYNDHGAGGFKELEVPKDWCKSPKDYICELELVPTWGERFDMGRIEWKKVRGPSKVKLRSDIANLRDEIHSLQSKLAKYELLLARK